jgi:hypothetical protein
MQAWKYHKESPLSQVKMSCFSFYFFSFFSYKIGEQDHATSPAQWGGVGERG